METRKFALLVMATLVAFFMLMTPTCVWSGTGTVVWPGLGFNLISNLLPGADSDASYEEPSRDKEVADRRGPDDF